MAETIDGGKVRALRESRGESRSQVAARMRIDKVHASADYVRQIETGRAGDIRTSKAASLASALGAHVEDLLGV